MNSAPFADGGVQEVIQISSLTEPSLEVIQVNPCGIGKKLRVLGPKFCGERLWNISLHRMEGQGRAASQNCSRTLLGRHVKSAASYTIARRCGGENMGRKKSAGYRINSNTIQCQATIAECVAVSGFLYPLFWPLKSKRFPGISLEVLCVVHVIGMSKGSLDKLEDKLETSVQLWHLHFAKRELFSGMEKAGLKITTVRLKQLWNNRKLTPKNT
ncbi:hypothetical protein C8J57DRAFT_1255411 [Mycena rebaudengoi]|nr:hypothetical protein C8J57DRAFT_1255411 [Mycena rebaudengoi]